MPVKKIIYIYEAMCKSVCELTWIGKHSRTQAIVFEKFFVGFFTYLIPVKWSWIYFFRAELISCNKNQIWTFSKFEAFEVHKISINFLIFKIYFSLWLYFQMSRCHWYFLIMFILVLFLSWPEAGWVWSLLLKKFALRRILSLFARRLDISNEVRSGSSILSELKSPEPVS